MTRSQTCSSTCHMALQAPHGKRATEEAIEHKKTCHCGQKALGNLNSVQAEAKHRGSRQASVGEKDKART